MACDLRMDNEVLGRVDVSSAGESSSSSSSGSAFRRMRLLSLGAVEEGVFGRESSSSESKGLERRADREAMLCVLRS